jgi:hypothetical protein
MIENTSRYEDMCMDEGNMKMVLFFKWHRLAQLQENAARIILQ